MRAFLALALAVILSGCSALNPYVSQRVNTLREQWVASHLTEYEKLVNDITYYYNDPRLMATTPSKDRIVWFYKYGHLFAQEPEMTKGEKLFRLSEILYERDINTEEKRWALIERQKLRNNLMQQWNQLKAEVAYMQAREQAFWSSLAAGAAAAYYVDSYYHGGYDYGYYYPSRATTTKIGNYYYTNYY